VWLVAADAPAASGPIGGRILSALPERQIDVEWPGAAIITVHRGMDSTSDELAYEEGQVITSESGYFSFSQALPPGMYTLRVRPHRREGAQIVESRFNVLWNEEFARLHVLALDEATVARGDTHAVLTWDATANVNVGLQLNFDFPATERTEESTQGCHVWSGRRTCGGASWARSPFAGSEVLTISNWIAETKYSLSAVFGSRRCQGYQVESSAALPGGIDGFIDCIGDCQTGRNYCYASSDGLMCANCVLWNPRAELNEVSCMERGGSPQGGFLPDTDIWELKGCNTAAWVNSGMAALGASLSKCQRPIEHSRLKLVLVERGVAVYSTQLSTIMDASAAVVAARLLCVSTADAQLTLFPSAEQPLQSTDPSVASCASVLEEEGQAQLARCPSFQWACVAP